MHPGELGKCRACDGVVRWVRTLSGTPMPLDRDPDPGGNVVVTFAGARVLRAGEKPTTLDSYLWMPHFATCPGRARGKAAQRRARERTLAQVLKQLSLDIDAAADDVDAVQRTLPGVARHVFRGRR